MTASMVHDSVVDVGRSRRRHVILHDPALLLGSVIVASWLVVGAFGPLLLNHPPNAVTPDLFAPPSGEHWFGTDGLGRDVFSRVVAGARLSVPIATALVIVSSVVGALIGALAGYFGGWVDEIVMRLTDLVFAFPGVVLALAITAALGPGLQNATLAIAVLAWPPYARVVRGHVLALRNSEFVAASRLRGASGRTALRREITPNLHAPVLVLATVDIGEKILLLAAISFLGLGVQAPTADWGSMIGEGTQNLGEWWIAVFPGAAIVTVVLAFNIVGDRVRAHLGGQQADTAKEAT